MIAQTGFSPKVALALLVNGRELALSHVGPDEVTVRDSCEPIPPSDAELLISVNDETESYRVFLPQGIPSAPQKVTYI
jgi:hypothetical protein